MNLKDAKNIDLSILKDALTREQQQEIKDDRYGRKERIVHLLAIVKEEAESFRRNDTWADEEARSIAARFQR